MLLPAEESADEYMTLTVIVDIDVSEDVGMLKVPALN